MVRLAQQPKTHVVFPAINHRHDGQDNVVQGRGKHRRENVAARQPRNKNRRQRLEAKQRSEPEKNANRHAAGDGFGRIANGQ